MLRAFSRATLSLADLQFVATVLCRPSEREATLLKLLADPEMRDAMLEHPRVFAALLEEQRAHAVSLFLYFYLITLHALRTVALAERSLAEYLANLMVEFGKAGRAFRVREHDTKEFYYLVDLMHEALRANHAESFYLRSHMGNYALFLTGIFPARVYHRAKYHPPAPDFSYYETVGSKSFRLAAQHAYAERMHLSTTFDLLGCKFRRVRQALNHAVDNFMHLDRKRASLDNVMRRVDLFAEQQRGEADEAPRW